MCGLVGAGKQSNNRKWPKVGTRKELSCCNALFIWIALALVQYHHRWCSPVHGRELPWALGQSFRSCAPRCHRCHGYPDLVCCFAGLRCHLACCLTAASCFRSCAAPGRACCFAGLPGVNVFVDWLKGWWCSYKLFWKPLQKPDRLRKMLGSGQLGKWIMPPLKSRSLGFSFSCLFFVRYAQQQNGADYFANNAYTAILDNAFSETISRHISLF